MYFILHLLKIYSCSFFIIFSRILTCILETIELILKLIRIVYSILLCVSRNFHFIPVTNNRINTLDVYTSDTFDKHSIIFNMTSEKHLVTLD